MTRVTPAPSQMAPCSARSILSPFVWFGLLAGILATATPFEEQHHDAAGGDPNSSLKNRVVHSCALLLLLTLSASPYLLHHGEQVLENLQQAWSGRHDEHGRQNKKENREDEFDADLAGSLFGFLAAARAQEV